MKFRHQLKQFLPVAALLGVMANLPRTALAQGDTPAVPGQIIVKMAIDASAADVDKVAEKAGCTVVRPVPYCPNFYIFRVKAETQVNPVKPTPLTLKSVSELTQDGKVLSAEPDYMARLAYRPRKGVKTNTWTFQGAGKTRATAPPGVSTIPNDPLYDRMWGLRAIRMPEAWTIQFGARPVVVGVLDSGIDLGHPDFAEADGTGSRILGGENFFGDGAPTVQDVNGHGTHCAGSIGATTNNSVPTGVASVAGWNRNNADVRFRIARVFGPALSAPLSEIAAGAGYLVDQNCDVISMSVGSDFDLQIFRDIVARGVAANIIMVAAAGNEERDNGIAPSYPAAYPGVIAVTSVGPSLTLASYSNFGGNVAITAPGGDGAEGSNDAIWSTWPRSGASLAPGVGGYWSISGTSMACPHVSGVCALLLSAGVPRNISIIRNAIQSTARPLDEVPNPNGGNKYGAGLIDAYSALLPFSDPPFSLGVLGLSSGVTAYRDRGQTYKNTVAPMTLQAIGVRKLSSQADVTVEVQSATIPTSILRTFVGGVDFTVPTIPSTAPPSTVVTFTVPGNGDPITLPTGRFKLVAKYQGNIVGTEFVEVVSRTQPIGRSMFATPFKVRDANSATPEQAALGNAAQFTLARYNVLRQVSDFDYSLWQTAGEGRKDVAASFAAVAPDGSPISFETSSPSVSIAPVGLGYWLNLDRAVTVNPVGPEVTNPVAIRLFAANGGWNMIGAPFTAPSAWGTLTVRVGATTYTLEDAINEGIIASALIGYNNGDYVYSLFPSGALQPFNGYWVRVTQDCTLIVAPTSTTRAAATRAAANPAPKGWRVRIGANVSGDRDAQNYFGVADGANAGVDKLDVPKPPSGAGHAYVRFLTETAPGRSVPQAFDIRPSGDVKATSWTLAVSTDRTNADVILNWDGIGNVGGRNDLVLTDTATGKTVDMRGRSTYTFRSGEAGSTRKFTVSLKPRLTSGPLAIQNVTVVSSGRSSGTAGVSIRFNTTREAEVRGVIKSLNGTVIADLSGATRATASEPATLRWNGRSRSGAAVPPGPYVVELTARTLEGGSATFSQPFQNLQ
jgi:subtilisin family serine protease